MNGEGGIAAAVDIGVEAKPPFVLLPDLSTVFRRRADRLAAVAVGHPMADYLGLIARIAAAQHAALDRLPPGSLPSKEELRRCREHGLPPMSRDGAGPENSWSVALERILAALADADMPPAAREAIQSLKIADEVALSALAERVLGGRPTPEDAAKAPFVAAALQVAWTRAAAMLDPDDLGPLEVPGACPACGCMAVASVIHANGNLHNARFLCCPLCATQWYQVRVKCACCGGEKSVAYYGIEGDDGAIKAETCGECRGYLKILNRNKNPAVEPVADDLASIALDLLVAEEGWQRASPNPFLVPQ